MSLHENLLKTLKSEISTHIESIRDYHRVAQNILGEVEATTRISGQYGAAIKWSNMAGRSKKTGAQLCREYQDAANYCRVCQERAAIALADALVRASL